MLCIMLSTKRKITQKRQNRSESHDMGKVGHFDLVGEV
jgi:hypothetical protein